MDTAPTLVPDRNGRPLDGTPGSPQPLTRVRAGDLAEELREFDVPAVDTSKVYSGTGYTTSQLSVLVARYACARGDLLVSAACTAAHSDPRLRPYAERVVEYLRSAKQVLEEARPTLPVASNLLSMAERALIWLYPAEILLDRCAVVRAELAGLRPPPAALLAQLDDVTERPDAVDPARETRTRQALTAASAHLHQIAETRLVEDDLQVNRLRRARLYLVLALLLVLAVVPVSVREDVTAGQIVWPILRPPAMAVEWQLLTGALGLAAVGAVGGIISGMLRVRDTRARLAEYRTSLLLLSLKPLLGAVAAVSLYLLLSWGTVDGIEVTSPGTYVLAAFLAGFSERYFLGVLRQEDGRSDRDDRRVASQPAS